MFILPIFVVIICVASAVEFPGFKKIPSHYTKVAGEINPSKVIHFKVALYPKNASELEKKLIQIATPGSKNFRKYLKSEQIAAIVGRDSNDLQRVREWFATHNAVVTSVHPHRDWVEVSAKVSDVETLFSCKLAMFKNIRNNSFKIMATGSYSVPDIISDVVHFVSGMTTFSSSRWGAVKSDLGATAAVTPATIYDMYQTPTTGSHGAILGSQAVVEFGAVGNFNTADLQTFFSTYQSSLLGETCGMAYGVNNGDIRPSVEANLDVQYIMAAGVFVNTTDYKITSLTPGESIEDEFLDYTTLVNSQNQPPLVHSISYGEYGGSYDNVTDQQFSYELQKMGISGISVLLASGDNGVGCDAAGTTQEFDYPSSPYITMVGATYVDAVSKLEVGATLSSGGFSKDFWVADWQKDAVDKYFAGNPSMPHEDFFRDGRAYPDIAAFGQNVYVIASGSKSAVSGTSCSAPIFAGVMAMINNELLAAGEAPLGFLNPWLYANPQMFNDVTAGSNPYQKCDGFVASAGWDPVTGLGTPVYPLMKDAAFAALKVGQQ